MSLTAELKRYGISGKSVRTFSSVTPELVDYLDLIAPRQPDRPSPSGVVENQGRPLLFFLDESHPSHPGTESDLTKLRRAIACRGERAYLARILPGELKVAPVRLDEKQPDWRTYRSGTREAETFFPRLVAGHYDGQGEPASDHVFREMFELLREGANRLAHTIDHGDVLSLVGRALFLRFLKDRQVITERDLKYIAPRAKTLDACFDTVSNAVATCNWLSSTFNGDFLPLSRGGGLKFFQETAKRTHEAVFGVLGAIVRRAEFVGEHGVQYKISWGDFDFAHIPVGLLSQVYEKFVWTWEGREARGTSVYYTPRNIATTLVEEAFDKLPQAHEARVLDPACGAGVFLVLAFRRLYRERWKATGRRPDTKDIRRMLDGQLTGFDISESALRLAALSLYLTAIELDPEPIPPQKLRFNALQGNVLLNCRHPDESTGGISIGSLGVHMGDRFDGKFDLVLSNPPWTALEETEAGRQVAQAFTKTSQNIIRKRADEQTAKDYKNPDSAPDMPFLWKSTEWCKARGRIAMALPARILFKQEQTPVQARNALFQLLEVTGIINGSNLSDTRVWPDMQQPFMLLFARNVKPKPGHVVRLITPYYDNTLNRRGEAWIDSKSAEPVELDSAGEAPWIWKALAVGTSLDVDVVKKLRAAGNRPLQDYWSALKLKSGNGYKLEHKSREKGKQSKQVDASFLKDLPSLDNAEKFDFVVHPDKLQKFQHATANRPRTPEIYKGPLVLVKESPGIDRREGWALFCKDDVAFDQSFYGYSGAGHADGQTLVRYLHLFVHSRLWMHYALLTSPKLGAERRTVYKGDLDDFPFIPLESLSTKQKRQIELLSARLERSDKTVFPELDAFFADVYMLAAQDSEVIEDTFNTCMPYKEPRANACRRPRPAEMSAFHQHVESLLRPFFSIIGKQVEVSLIDSKSDALAPFSVLRVGIQAHQPATKEDDVVNKLIGLATEAHSTLFILEAEAALVVGILNQYRYWTRSRGRLLAAEILRDHMAVFEER